MIKKIGNIVIIFLLIIATGGIPITRHYCGSVVMSFSVYSTPTSCCVSHCTKCHDGCQKHHKGCDKCRNVLKFSKVIDAFDSESSITTTHSLTNDIEFYSSSFFNLAKNFPITSHPSLINQRANYHHEAHSPASLGDFLC